MGLPELKNVSMDEYLTAERQATQKHEYYMGEIFAMSGASLQHNMIFRNTFLSIGAKLKGKSCQPFGSDLRIHIPKNTLFTYPDITIICGKPETTDDTFDTVTNPSVIIEILSKSTRQYDKSDKFMLYRDVSSLQEYILIDSESIRIEKYKRNADDSWLLTDYKISTNELRIETVDISMLISDIYQGVEV